MDQPPVMPPATPPAMQTGRPGPASDTSKLLAALGYPIWIVALIAILIDPYKDEQFVRFHAAQALGYNLAWFILGIALFWIPVIGEVLWVVWLVIAIVWAVRAYNGEYAEMPIIYNLVSRYI